MAAQCTVTTRALKILASQNPAFDFDTSTFKIGLLKAAIPTAASIKDYNFVSDLTAACAEATAAGYARKVSGTDFTLTVNEEDSNDRATVTISADPTWAAIATGDTLYGAFLMIDRGGADTANELVLVIEFASSFPTNGSGVTVTFPTDAGTVRTLAKIS